MKSILFLLIAVLAGASFAKADVCAMYACALSTSKDQSVRFPLLCENGRYSAEEPNETSIFELTPVDPSQMKGLPVYKNGTYYAGGNDVFVLFKNKKGFVYRVIKPFETDPNTNKTPSIYNCALIQNP